MDDVEKIRNDDSQMEQIRLKCSNGTIFILQ